MDSTGSIESLRPAILALTLSICAHAADAANFADVHYDPATDELVLTMAYRGTNPDHTFSLRWGACEDRDGEREVAVEVLDSQWRDAARREFRKTQRFSLADVDCRPAAVTLRSAPGFFVTLSIPAPPGE